MKGKCVTCVPMIIVLLLCLSIASKASAYSVDNYSDLGGHWAYKTISKWIDAGIVTISGDRFDPDLEISRVEFFSYITRLFYVTAEADIGYATDVPADAAYYATVRRAVAMGAIQGDGSGSMMPLYPIEREQVAVIISRILSLLAVDKGNLSRIPDNAEISEWARDAVSACVSGKYMVGDTDGNFTPHGKITRAEAVQIIDNLASAYYRNQALVEDMDGKNVVIATSDTTLRGANIAGDLIIADGCAAGQVTIEDTVVGGNIILRGGNTVTLRNVNVGNEVIVNKVNDEGIAVIADARTDIPALSLSSKQCTLNAQKAVRNLYVYADGASLAITGRAGTLDLGSSNFTLNVAGNLSALVIGKSATKARVNVTGTLGKLSNSAGGTVVTNSGVIESLESRGNITLTGNEPQAILITSGAVGRIGAREIIGDGTVLTGTSVTLGITGVTVNGEAASLTQGGASITLSEAASPSDGALQIDVTPTAGRDVIVTFNGVASHDNTTTLRNLSWDGNGRAFVEIGVTAVDDANQSKRYTLIITRQQPPHDTTLRSLQINGAEAIGDGSSGNKYKVYLPGYNAQPLAVIATATNPSSVNLAVNGLSVASGTSNSFEANWYPLADNTTYLGTTYTHYGTVTVTIEDKLDSAHNATYTATVYISDGNNVGGGADRNVLYGAILHARDVVNGMSTTDPGYNYLYTTVSQAETYYNGTVKYYTSYDAAVRAINNALYFADKDVYYNYPYR